jgi:uncharacterized protein
MQRDAFHKLFKAPGPVVLPVIHVLDAAQAIANAGIAISSGAAGVFLINHDFPVEPFLPIIRAVRARYPSLWLGVNFLAVTGRDAFPILGELARQGVDIDAYWADDARIDEHAAIDHQVEADEIARVRTDSGWTGLYFGGTCFKKQREVAPSHYGAAAARAVHCMDVVTTSGVATAHAPDLAKVRAFRSAIGDATLALASGITPDNAHHFAGDVDCFMVATGINRPGDFYNLDAVKLSQLMDLTRAAACAPLESKS